MMWKWGWSYPCKPSGHRPKVKFCRFCSASSLWASHLSHWKAIDRGSRSTRFSQPVMARRLGWKMTQSFGCSRRWKKIGSLEIWSCFHEGSPGQDTWHTWHISTYNIMLYRPLGEKVMGPSSGRMVASPSNGRASNPCERIWLTASCWNVATSRT